MLGHVDPVEGGQFRRTQVYVGGHIPPGPGDIHYLMEEFVLWLNSEQAIRMHPVRCANFIYFSLYFYLRFCDKIQQIGWENLQVCSSRAL